MRVAPPPEGAPAGKLRMRRVGLGGCRRGAARLASHACPGSPACPRRRCPPSASATGLSDAPVRSRPTERLRDVLDPAGYAALLAVRERADRLLGGSAVWC